ncbi:unnamed protein product [Chondrus crispus]|uniref:Uncharacterized protein n=1 Tax=Chondrus crispus TaxID=2769 RepID=R7QC86_CHOCR|nr:unnamed protein product [Chondrus crispus]CDF35070.1 unnamed protein product [Chondrus crispus]|eukprot:XP_005714889.1 unnamed protein product [Chondrus crispus]
MLCLRNKCTFKNGLSKTKCHSSTQRECASCRQTRNCAKGLTCWKNKCVNYNNSHSRTRCFHSTRGECAWCSHHSQCKSGMFCGNNKCVFSKDPRSARRCFPGNKKECATCIHGTQCANGMQCWRNKCINFRDSHSLRRCFSSVGRECSTCRDNQNCANGMHCLNKKCVSSKDPRSARRCFPVNYGECSTCRDSKQCANGLQCRKNKCVRKTTSSIAKCFPTKKTRECGQCKHTAECAGRLQCLRNKCLYPGTRSTRKCGKQECWKCNRTTDCSSGLHCYHNKCVHKHIRSIRKCFPLSDCSKCTQSFECKSKRCLNRVCAANITSFRKCFPRKECAACTKSSQCSAGSSCYRGRCVNLRRPYAVDICFPKRECAICAVNHQCATKRCINKRCVYPNIHSHDKCHRVKQCGFCVRHTQCGRLGRCINKKCVVGTHRYSIYKCFPKKECDACHHNIQCKTGLCYKKKCISRTLASKRKCFPGQRCEFCNATADCASGFACQLTALNGKKLPRCVQLMNERDSCRLPCAVCKSGLVCGANKRCVKRLSPRCGGCIRNQDCQAGLKCQGQRHPSQRGKCVQEIGLNTRCDVKCSVCKRGLQCRHGKICKKRQSAKCGKCSKDDDCRTGLRCRGASKTKPGKCKEIQTVGKSCRGECDVCRQGLTCRDNKICKPPRATHCGLCKVHDDCKHGLRCQAAKRQGERSKCVQLLRKGAKCGKGCRACNKGLECRQGVCKPLRSEKCGKCISHDDCKRGLTCKFVGKERFGKCHAVVSFKGACHADCSVCQRGLECHRGKVCLKPLKQNCQPCWKHQECVSGLCKPGPHGKPGQCLARRTLGQNCSDKCSICIHNLVCKNGVKCERPKSERCGPCKSDTECGKNLTCASTGTHKKAGQCVETVRMWGTCGKKCTRCENHLTCKHGICLAPIFSHPKP